MIRVIGCDPGLKTGLCSFSVVEDQVANVEHWQLDHIGTASWFEQWRDHYLVAPTETVVAMESFIITAATGKKTQAPWSLETIGAVRYFVETAGLSLRFSAPSAHKALVKDDVLKRAGLWFPGEGHACDAARVGLHVTIVDHKLIQWALKEEA